MSNHDRNQEHQTDNFFDEEIGNLLGDFSDRGNPSSDNEDLEDIASLLTGDGSIEFPSWEETPFEDPSLTSLPSEDEISNLFNENFAWEEENGRQNGGHFVDRPEASSSDRHSELADDDFATFVGDTDVDRNHVRQSDRELSSVLEMESNWGLNLEENDLDDLKELLGCDGSHPSPAPSETLQDLAAMLEEPSTVEPQDRGFDELESFLEEASPLDNQPINGNGIGGFDNLENLINDVVAIPDLPSTPATAKNADEDFQDLEQLLEQTDRAMGGPPSNTSGTRQRPPSRPKPPSAKGFEQTMRVPVKQLDNLSNLIGELVIKRNSLEQDQGRLRQFLDNLLAQVQNLSDLGIRMQDLYERTLLEGALLASRNQGRANATNFDRLPIENGAEDVLSHLDRDLDALEMDRFTGFHLLSQEMIELIVRVREATSDIQFLVDSTDQIARSLRQVTTQLQEGMNNSRMVPFAQTAERLPRAVREVSLKQKKQAKLQVEGRDILIDKMILEQLYNPMTHLVNNAISHGIESPQEREAKGKPAGGTVMVRAFLQGNQSVITVSDDGAGIDPERVRNKAVEKSLISAAEAQALSNTELYDFLFHPGFSTKDKADDFAGRGVGLDVVRTNLDEIRGSVSIDSEIGKGTTFTIRLPLNLSICKALCCLSDRARIAFSMDGVEDMRDYVPEDLPTNDAGVKCLKWEGDLLPIYPLHQLLSYNRHLSRSNIYGGQQDSDTITVVVLRSGSNLLAVRVDRVIGEQEIVIKPIAGPIPKPLGIAGATVLGDGSVMAIGDVLELMEIAQGRIKVDGSGTLWKKTYVPVQSEPQEVKTEPMVLIVDDSITIRQMLSYSFSKAGYRVEQARDGQEALEKLTTGLACDLVFCDIEMPNMNGLELLANLQKDKALCEIPVTLLTSRGADRHRQLAAKLGATGYLTKPYTEKDLLDTAERMLQGEVLLPASTKTPKVVKPVEETSNSTPNASGNGGANSQHMVLIVDDSVMVREMLSLTFTKAGYKIEKARDGQDAWEKLRDGLPCDLILCDIEMPRMNGLELLSRLQEDPHLSAIPMAMITSRGAQKMQNIAAERGAKGYFVKPYIEEVVLDAAKRLIAGEVLLEKGTAVEN